MFKSPVSPVRDIEGSVNRYLEGKTLILGLTGSVAAYKAVDTARWLIRRAATVIPVMTFEARKYVGVDLLHWATGVKPLLELTGETEHIGLVKASNAMLVAPATLSTMSKIAHGIADNPVALMTISAIGFKKPTIIVPAMHSNMAETPQYSNAVEALEASGALIVPPRLEESTAKYPEPELVARIAAAAASRGFDMKGLRVLVTAGPTREWIDRVRFISNPSSGKMGVEVAVEAWARGARVDLIHGPLTVNVPHMVNAVKVETTEEMYRAVSKLTEEREYDVIVAAAAPVDFTPRESYEGKIKSGVELTLNLKPTPKVLEGLKRKPKVLVAFAAEHTTSREKLVEAAREKMAKYSANIVIANPVGFPGTGFSSDMNTALIAKQGEGERLLGSIHKEILARLILDEALRIIRGTQ